MPKVSICVPIYNVEQYIGRCIESIQNQTFSDIEIIIVNDCTPDNSMKIVEKYAKVDSRIKVLNHECNKGLMWARRTGYMAAISDYITFCDSDDTLVSDAVEMLYRKAIETGADVVAGGLQFITVTGRTLINKNILRFGDDKEAVYKSLLLSEFGHNLCSKLFKRELLQEHSYQTFEHFINGEDGCLFYQVVENTKRIVAIERIVYNYYQNLESSTQVRLSDKGIKSIVLLNRIRVEKCSNYPNLSRDLYRFVFNVFNNQFMNGYGDLTNKYALEYGLDKFLDYNEAKKYFTLIEFLKLVMRMKFKKLSRI